MDDAAKALAKAQGIPRLLDDSIESYLRKGGSKTDKVDSDLRDIIEAAMDASVELARRA